MVNRLILFLIGLTKFSLGLENIDKLNAEKKTFLGNFFSRKR